jgi:hypothetical protein
MGGSIWFVLVAGSRMGEGGVEKIEDEEPDQNNQPTNKTKQIKVSLSSNHLFSNTPL